MHRYLFLRLHTSLQLKEIQRLRNKRDSNTVSVIDTRTNTVVDTVEGVAVLPESIAMIYLIGTSGTAPPSPELPHVVRSAVDPTILHSSEPSAELAQPEHEFTCLIACELRAFARPGDKVFLARSWPLLGL